MTDIPSPPLAAAAPSPRPKRTSWDIQREVIFALVIREASARVGGQWVGAVWTLLEPFAHMLIMVALYGIVLERVAPAGEYPVFLVTGLVPYFLFQNLLNRSMDAFEANKGLFAYRQVKPLDVLVSRAIVEAGMTLLVYVFTLGVLAWLGYSVVPADPLAMIGTNGLMIAIGTGVGLLMALLTFDRPRARSMVRMVLIPLYLISGVIFPVDALPRQYLEPLLWNPLLHVIELSRHAFIPAYRPAAGVGALYPVLCMLTVLSLGLLLYRAKRQLLVST